MYFGDAAAADGPDDRAARAGRASAAICGNGPQQGTSPAVRWLVTVSCGSEGRSEIQAASTVQPVSVSAAYHGIWHPALVESIASLADIAPSLDMSWVDISPACLQQLEAERSMPQT